MKIAIICILLYLLISAWANRLDKRKSRQAYKSAFRQIEREHKAFLREQEKQAKEIEKLEKEQRKQAAQLERLYFRVDKCEDEIAHFTELADRLTGQRDAMQAEIDSITKRLEHADGTLDPLNAKNDNRFDGHNGAMLYMEMYASTLDDTRTAKQRQADADKLIKHRDTLIGKVISLDNRIFAAEQRAKKAVCERDIAEKELSA